MSRIIEILNFEEGYVETPYHDTLGFPTVAGGIRIGPKGASLRNYTFTVPRSVGNCYVRPQRWKRWTGTLYPYAPRRHERPGR